KGISFGANINASTSYDETIYRLNDIPLQREGIIDTALLVLHDWSGFINNNDKDIDEERGVVGEEWRTRSSGYLRAIENGINPAIFAGTPYATRIPIGSIDVINHFKYQELRDYYKKWYRPDLQAIIIIGDIDEATVIAKLTRLFADIPAPVHPGPRIYTPIPDNKQPIVAIAADPEIRSVSLQVCWKIPVIPFEQRSSLRAFKMSVINRLISARLMNRIYQKTDTAGSPLASASVNISSFQIAATRQALTMYLTPAGDKNALDALRIALAEAERMRRFGITDAEIAEYTKSEAMLAEMSAADKNNHENFEFFERSKSMFTDNRPFPPEEWTDKTTSQILSSLSADTVNYWIRQYITDENMVYIFQGPQKDDFPLPAKDDIVSAWAVVKNMPLEPYKLKDKKPEDDLTALKPIGGKIIKTEPAPFGYTQWTLSNGMRVQFKNTGYDESKLVLYGYSPGGYSLVPQKDL
ncbi:MAG TPA: pitrilysin family protein, partial [Chitinophagaceae bacterium]|nr:pitrilysin family protein [Chitinophagaceae bacterium]